MPFFKQKAASFPEPGQPFDEDFADMPFEEPEQPRSPRLYRQIRRDARRCLFSRWAKAAAGVLFLMGIVVVFGLARSLLGGFFGTSGHAAQWNHATGTLTLDPAQMILDGAVFLLSQFILCPLMLGYLRFIYQMTSGEEPVLAVIFEPMQNAASFLRSFLLSFVLQLMGALATAVCCLPGGLVLWAVQIMDGTSGTGALLRIALLLLGILLVILGILAESAVMTRYIAAPFILAVDEKAGVFSALHLSSRATKGFRGELFAMLLSFLPLALLCVLLVPVLFVLPYMVVTCALFSRFLLDRLAKVREE